jgi:GDP/UDP-N,N'-diacetylbacillosamine 2-epimerase (hydrolysing)
MSKINIAIVTGTRAEFGIWSYILDAIRKSRRFKLSLVVTGMHLQREFGYTVRDIEDAGFAIDARVPMYRKGRTPAENLAAGTVGLARAFRQLRPDLVMVLGDRLEMLAAGSAALAEQLPIAHVHGGETAPGQWDEQIRHALTKMAHLHFCATEQAGRRILQMGEPPERVHVIGAPALDGIMYYLPALERAIPRQNHALVLLHPSSPHAAEEERRTTTLLRALRTTRMPFQVIGPNNDPGHEGILRAYDKAGLEMWLSLQVFLFWQELLRSAFLIGNSSSGILEAASFGLPVINLGDRQAGRERNANVIDVRWSAGASGIQRAIRCACTNKPFLTKVAKRKNLYGDGHATERVLKTLESLPFPLSTTKRFYDH